MRPLRTAGWYHTDRGTVMHNVESYSDRGLGVRARFQCGVGAERDRLVHTPGVRLCGACIQRCYDAMAGPGIYRCWNADGDLLYIGATTQISARLAQHRCSSRWWAEVANWSFTPLDDDGELPARVRLEAVEWDAIGNEDPRYNRRRPLRAVSA